LFDWKAWLGAWPDVSGDEDHRTSGDDRVSTKHRETALSQRKGKAPAKHTPHTTEGDDSDSPTPRDRGRSRRSTRARSRSHRSGGRHRKGNESSGKTHKKKKHHKKRSRRHRTDTSESDDDSDSETTAWLALIAEVAECLVPGDDKTVRAALYPKENAASRPG
jgi:hypothetical protein